MSQNIVPDPVWEWGVDQLRTALAQDQTLTLIDCRMPQEWQQGVIASAKCISMPDIPERVEDLAAFPAPVVVICKVGGRSLRVAAFLRAQGLDAWSVAGGMDAWNATQP